MEKSEISIHEVKIAKATFDHKGWITSLDVSAKTGVASRTCRMHLKRLTELGIVDLAEVFPAHRYRWSEKADRRNKAYYLRLVSAAEVFGVKLS